ncbi:multicopper oxidase family protein [Fodinibius sp. Rm-B-1B1-1]|uniref:multicopper oxidase family protein n=1 Tax=Fodinibius alkaliphilus TaxID=3140241 RepID=UPI00315A2631
MKRKEFLKLLSIGTGVATFSPGLLACTSDGNTDLALPDNAFSRSLVFPEEIRANDFELAAETARHTLAGDTSSDVYTLNGSLPSPTIRVKRGESLAIDYQNRIDQESIIHWHGLIVPPDMDGHPKDAVQPGQTYNYRFDIDQRAGTYWYHPHPDKLTGPQVYRGLGGLFIIEDEEEQALNLPSGDYELPLIVQDKRFNDSGQMTYNLNRMDRRMGFFGNTILVNGMQAPYHEVSNRFYRLRLLNGSNARILDFSFSDDSSFYVIGSDGGLHDRPYEISSITLTPGERADLLVDFSGYEAGKKVRMTAEPRNGMGGMMNGMMDGGRNGNRWWNRGRRRNNRDNDGGNMCCGRDGAGNSGGAFLEFRITNKEEDSFRLPQALTELSFPDEADADRTRRIDLTMEMMRGPAIDGKFFEMLRADQTVQQGALEVWEFNNRTGMPHPMHLHATQFKVLDRSRGSLAPHERGWKDTVRVERRETVRMLTKFDAEKGLYAFHCHNLEHEDNGMMANFEIV